MKVRKQTLTKIYKTFKSFESVKNVHWRPRVSWFSIIQTSYEGTVLFMYRKMERWNDRVTDSRHQRFWSVGVKGRWGGTASPQSSWLFPFFVCSRCISDLSRKSGDPKNVRSKVRRKATCPFLFIFSEGGEKNVQLRRGGQFQLSCPLHRNRTKSPSWATETHFENTESKLNNVNCTWTNMQFTKYPTWHLMYKNV